MRLFILIILVMTCVLEANLLQQGNDFYERGELDSAIILYNRSLHSGENEALCHVNLGNCYYQKRDLAKAAAHYRLSIESAPHFFRPYYNLTMIYYQLEDHAGALAMAQQALELQPENSRLLLTMASLYRDLNDRSGAIFLLERNRELVAEEVYLTHLLYELYCDIGEYEQAVKLIQHSENIDFSEGEREMLLGHAWRELGRWIQAELAYRNALPFRSEAHYLLFESMVQQGKELSALIQAELSLKEHPDLTNLAFNAGEIALKRNLYRKAELFWMTAYRAGDSRAVVALQNLMRIYRNSGDITQEQRMLRTIRQEL